MRKNVTINMVIKKSLLICLLNIIIIICLLSLLVYEVVY